MGLAAVVVLAGLVVAWVLAEPWLAQRRRDRLRARPFPTAWREIIDRRIPYMRRLPPALRAQLERHVQVFLAEKAFIGCDGQEITDEVRVTIAAQACLLILDRGNDYFPALREILVYPGAFLVERVVPGPDPALQSHVTQALSGESWTRGQVIVSWEDAVDGAAIPDDGRNVVIHEFAHQLDQQKGYANGAPWLGRRDRYPRWSRVMSAEFARLRQSLAFGEATLLGPYAATSPAEFFAVASEVFFERSRELAALHPDLYGELRTLYGIDPASW